MPTKVMIAVSTQDYVHINFAFALALLISGTKDIQLQLSTGRGSNICQNRNLLVHVARKEQCEYIMFIDNDMSFPPFSVNRMVKIVEEKNIDILGCNYLFKSPPHRLMVVPKNKQPQTLTGIDEVDALPTGMMLIRTSVFDRIEPPYFLYAPAYENEVHTNGTEDFYFCDKARASGIKIFMDSDLSFSLIHWGSPFGVQWMPEPPNYRYVTEPLTYTESEDKTV